MHSVEEKVFVVLVPNAPCGVEIYNTILFHSEQKHKFLMHRVELKFGSRSILTLPFTVSS